MFFLLTSHARSWFRQPRRGRFVHSLAALRLRYFHGDNRLDFSDRHGKVFAFPGKGQAFLLFVVVDANQIAQMNLFGRQQVRQWVDDVALNRALQVTRTVPLISSLLQQEVASRTRHAELELSPRRFQYPLLNLAQFDFEHFFKLRSLQRMKHYHFVQPVHELR